MGIRAFRSGLFLSHRNALQMTRMEGCNQTTFCRDPDSGSLARVLDFGPVISDPRD